MNNYYAITYSNSLEHHGIKGMKWGIRRFQNEDGSLTPDGRKRYSVGESIANKKRYFEARRSAKKAYKARNNKIFERTDKVERETEKKYKKGDTLSKEDYRAQQKRYAEDRRERADSKKQYREDIRKAKEDYKANQPRLSTNQKRAIAIGAGIAVAGLAAYGVYKINQRDKAEMKEWNSRISEGKRWVDSAKNNLINNPLVIDTKASYHGNDFKMHTATIRRTSEGIDFKNLDADTQHEFKTLKEFRKARKNFRRGN